MRCDYIFCVVLIDMISDFKNHENIHVILFYDDNVCLGFGRWFFGHLLLKIIFSMKRCYMGFGGFVEKCVGFVCVLF